MAYTDHLTRRRGAKECMRDGVPFTVLVRETAQGNHRISPPVHMGHGRRDHSASPRRWASYAIRVVPKASAPAPSDGQKVGRAESRTETYIRDAAEMLRENRMLWFSLGVEGVLVSVPSPKFGVTSRSLIVSWAELESSKTNPLIVAARHLLGRGFKGES